MIILKHKIKFFILSAVLVLFSLFSVFFFGLNLGIEFTGGAITEVRYPNGRPEAVQVKNSLNALPLGDVLVQPTGENGFIIRTKELNQEERAGLFALLSEDGAREVIEQRYSLVGPSIGKELRTKAWIAILLVAMGIVLFVAFAFRKVGAGALTEVGTKVRSWHYGFIAIIALLHDVIIPTGVFAFLGSVFVDAQIDVLFVTALLAILGYSVNDTIVIFDRVRENLRKNQELKLREPFEETVGKSVTQSYARSINTSLTTLFVLLALFFAGGQATQNFALVLAIGVVAGTYSSLFLATPLLVVAGKLKTER